MPDTSKRNRTIAAFRQAGGDQEVARRFLANCKHADDIIEKPDGGKSSSRRSDEERDTLRAALVAYGICFGDETPRDDRIRSMIADFSDADAKAMIQVCVPHREQPRFTHHLYRSEENRAQWIREVAAWKQLAKTGKDILTHLQGQCERAAKLNAMVETTITSLRDNAMVSEMILASIQPGGGFATSENDRLVVIQSDRLEQAMCVYERMPEQSSKPGYLKVHYLCSAPWNIFDPEPSRNRRVRGAGQYALEDAIRRADQREVTKGHVRLDAMTENVIAFYERRGFEMIDDGLNNTTGNFPMELVTVTKKKKKK